MTPTLAHFIHRYPPARGGAEAYAARLGDYLGAKGYRVIVWTTTAVTLDELWNPSSAATQRGALPVGSRLNDPVEVRRFRPRSFPLRRPILKALSLIPHRPWQAAMQPVNPLVPGLTWNAAIYNGPLEAVHAFAFPFSGLALTALKLARRRRVPLLLTPFLHLGDPDDPRDPTRAQYTRPHLRWLLRQANSVFAQTPREAEEIERLGVPRERIVLQGLGVDAGECTGGDRARVRKEWGVGEDDVVVGHLANLSEEKGSVDLLKASDSPLPLGRGVGGEGGLETGNQPSFNPPSPGSQRSPPSPHGERVKFVLAGTSMPKFERFWQTFPGKDRVLRLGELTDPQKRDFFAGIDVFALPSRTDSFGLVILEAWANGVPVVAYRAGGPGELLRDDVDGLLVECGNIGELRAKLRMLIEDPELRKRLGEAGRSRALRDFGWERSLKVVWDRLP